MAHFTSSWGLAPSLPDGHLIGSTWKPTARGIHVDVHFRTGHVSPDLMRDLSEYFRHLTRSGVYELVPERALDPPEFYTTYERVNPALMPLRTFAVRRRGPHYLFYVRSDLMTQEAVDEMNNDFLPPMQGALRSVEHPAPVDPVLYGMLDDLTDVHQ